VDSGSKTQRQIGTLTWSACAECKHNSPPESCLVGDDVLDQYLEEIMFSVITSDANNSGLTQVLVCNYYTPKSTCSDCHGCGH